MKRSGPIKRKTPLRSSTYRTLTSDEPDPPGSPLVYEATDGRLIQRWKVAPRTYVERPLRNLDGSPTRGRPMEAKRVDLAEAARRYADGETMEAIAAALDCHPATLSRGLRRLGVTPRTSDAYATPFDANEVVRRHASGEGHVSIARSMGVSVDRVKSTLSKAGVPLRGAGAVKGKRKSGAVTYQTEFNRIRPLVRERSAGRCEAAVSPDCSRRATHVHHRRMRSQGGSNELENLLDVCHECHAWIHGNPSQSYDLGLLLHAAPMDDSL